MIILQHATTIEIEPAHVDHDVDIAIDGNTILAVGRNLSAEYPEADCYDMNGLTVMPGLVCSHNHFYSALARGITTGIKPSTDFVQVLQHLWWRLDTAIDDSILQASGQIGVLEAIRSGVTAVAAGTSAPGTAVQRIATTVYLVTRASTSVSALPGTSKYNDLLFF